MYKPCETLETTYGNWSLCDQYMKNNYLYPSEADKAYIESGSYQTTTEQVPMYGRKRKTTKPSFVHEIKDFNLHKVDLNPRSDVHNDERRLKKGEIHEIWDPSSYRTTTKPTRPTRSRPTKKPKKEVLVHEIDDFDPDQKIDLDPTSDVMNRERIEMVRKFEEPTTRRSRIHEIEGFDLNEKLDLDPHSDEEKEAAINGRRSEEEKPVKGGRKRSIV